MWLAFLPQTIATVKGVTNTIMFIRKPARAWLRHDEKRGLRSDARTEPSIVPACTIYPTRFCDETVDTDYVLGTAPFLVFLHLILGDELMPLSNTGQRAR